jgi:DNA-binding protein YbaB
MASRNTFNEELDQLLEEYRKRRAEAGERQRKIQEISATAVAPRQTVKVTVGAQGEITALEFPTSAYKRMAPNELAEAILGAAREAKGKALEAYKELMTPMLPAGLNFLDLVQGKADLAAAIPAEPQMPDVVREYVEHGRMAGNERRDDRG